MRNCEIISGERRGYRSHHIVLGVTEADLDFVSSTHPHGAAGFEAAQAQVKAAPELHLVYARAYVDYVPGLGIHGKKTREGGDGIAHTTEEYRSERHDFQRVQELKLTSQLTDHPNLNVTRTPTGDLIITENLADQHCRKIIITSAPDMLSDHGTRTDLAIVVSEEIEGEADPEQNSLLGVNLFLQPPDISVERLRPNLSAKELLQTVMTGMCIFQIFAALEKPSRDKFSGKLTDFLNPNSDRYKELNPRHAHLLRALSQNRFKLSHSGY